MHAVFQLLAAANSGLLLRLRVLERHAVWVSNDPQLAGTN
jgi:hypothetical protein